MKKIKKGGIVLFVSAVLLLFVSCPNPFILGLIPEKEPGEPSTGEIVPYNIEITLVGNEGTDTVSASPAFGNAGAEITITYTVDDTEATNRLEFS